MGCFGYICRGCGSSIRGNCFSGGEKAILIHVRNGIELGRVEGHYNEYGGVYEQEGMNESEKFRGDGDSINSHKEICESELRLDNAYSKVKERRMYEGVEHSYTTYFHQMVMEETAKHKDVRNSEYYPLLEDNIKEEIEDLYSEMDGSSNDEKLYARIDLEFSFGMKFLDYEKQKPFREKFLALPVASREKYSGIVAWHSKCYHKASKKEQEDLTPSESDPNQSWGTVRKKYS